MRWKRELLHLENFDELVELPHTGDQEGARGTWPLHLWKLRGREQ